MRIALSSLALVLAASAAQAQNIICAPYTIIRSNLQDVHQMRLSGAGEPSHMQGHTLEMWTHDQGAWVVLIISPARVACVIADGPAWVTPEGA